MKVELVAPFGDMDEIEEAAERQLVKRYSFTIKEMYNNNFWKEDIDDLLFDYSKEYWGASDENVYFKVAVDADRRLIGMAFDFKNRLYKVAY